MFSLHVRTHWLCDAFLSDIPAILHAFSFANKLGNNYMLFWTKTKQTNNSVARIRERTIPSDRRLLAKLVPTFVDRGCHVVRMTHPYGHILGFLDRSRYYFFQVAPQLYSRGWVDPVPDPLLLRESGSAGNRTRTFGSVARISDN
jgi:hypothetical protein